jgi:hypothetical protein
MSATKKYLEDLHYFENPSDPDDSDYYLYLQAIAQELSNEVVFDVLDTGRVESELLSSVRTERNTSIIT